MANRRGKTVTATADFVLFLILAGASVVCCFAVERIFFLLFLSTVFSLTDDFRFKEDDVCFFTLLTEDAACLEGVSLIGFFLALELELDAILTLH